jgi:hypothetical protein
MVKNTQLPSLARSFGAALAASALALLLVASAGRADSSSVNWTAPTPADQAKFSVSPGKSVSFSLSASTAEPGAIVHIAPAQALPTGVSFNSADGVTAQASFKWTPETPGDYTIAFTASLVGTTTVAPTLTYSVHVKGTVLSYPFTSTLTDKKVARWAQVLKRVPVYRQPKASGRAVTKLDTMTTDGTHNIVLVLSERALSPTKSWYRIRLPILPNNSTGWVQSSALGRCSRSRRTCTSTVPISGRR